MHLVRRHLVVCVLATLGLLAGAGTALAHNVLISSNPADGANLDAGPARISLTFDLPVRESFSIVTLIGPDSLHYERGPTVVDGNTVGTTANPLGPAGRYTVGYRIVSDDGHPVTGSVSFTLTRPGTGRGVPGNTGSSGSPEGTQPADTGIPAWPWILGGVLLVAAGAAIALRLGRGD